MPSIMRNNVRYGSSINVPGDGAIEITKAEYEALGDSVLNDNKTYYITDLDMGYNASTIAYAGNDTGLEPGSVQSAIDNLSEQIAEHSDSIGELSEQIVEQNKKVDQVFQLGSNRKSDLVTALNYSGLRITSSSTWEDIFSKLSAFFSSKSGIKDVYYHLGGYTQSLRFEKRGSWNASGNEVIFNDTSYNYIYVYSQKKGSGTNIFVASTETINVTNLKSIKALITYETCATPQFRFMLAKKGVIGTGNSSWDAVGTCTKYVTDGDYNDLTVVFTLDVSSLTGEYEIGFGANGSSTTNSLGKIYKIWTE